MRARILQVSRAFPERLKPFWCGIYAIGGMLGVVVTSVAMFIVLIGGLYAGCWELYNIWAWTVCLWHLPVYVAPIVPFLSPAPAMTPTP